MTETPDLRWFEGIARPKCIQCGKWAAGVLRGVRNESYGPHCQKCADKRLAASKKLREGAK